MPENLCYFILVSGLILVKLEKTFSVRFHTAANQQINAGKGTLKGAVKIGDDKSDYFALFDIKIYSERDCDSPPVCRNQFNYLVTSV